MESARFKYHRAAVELAEFPIRISPHAVETLNAIEQRHGIRIPPAVREWYSIEGAANILGWHSNDDHPHPVDELAPATGEWHAAGPHDYAAEPILEFMHENQGVCRWGARLDGSEDPEVVVEVDSDRRPGWRHCADHFSTFVFTLVWDFPRWRYAHHLAAQEVDFSTNDKEFLSGTLRELPATHGWPGDDAYRFESPHGRVVIWWSREGGTDWYLFSQSANDLRQLAAHVWNCGTLRDSLYGVDPSGESLLKELRQGSDQAGPQE